MSAGHDQTLEVLVERMRGLVAASAGWIVARQADASRVVAVSGDVGMLRVGSVVDGGSASYVASTGQPLALAPQHGDAFVEQGAVALLGRVPTALISLPCPYSDDVVGAVELVDKSGGARFSLDDLEIAGAFADVAGVALATAYGDLVEVASAEQLGAELRRLEQEDPQRFRSVSWAVGALLSSG